MQPVQDPRPEEEVQRPSHGDEHKKAGVLFQIGDDEVEESSMQHAKKKHRKPSHVHKQHSREHHGNEAYENHSRPVTPTEGELEEHDKEDIGVHRFEKSKISHHVAHAVKNHPLTKQVSLRPWLTSDQCIGESGAHGRPSHRTGHVVA
jgi:hypothetical protein